MKTSVFIKNGESRLTKKIGDVKTIGVLFSPGKQGEKSKMVTITACYYFSWLKNVKNKDKKLSQGMMRTYETIVRCTYGSDFTWVTPQGLARNTGMHQRTIERHIPSLIEAGVIARGYSEENQRKGFYLLPHPELLAYAKRFEKKVKLIVRETASIGSEAEEIKDNGTIENGNLSEELSDHLYKGINNEIPPLPPCESEAENHEPCMAGSDEQREECFVTDDEQTPPVVSTVLAEIGQERAYIPLVALVKSSIIHVDGEKIQIKTGKYSLKIIKKHLPTLEDAFQRHGITAVSFSVMSENEENQHTEHLLAKERHENAKRQQQARFAAQQAEIAERQRIARLPEKEQFRLLAASYPSPENGYTETRAWDIWPAWKSYTTMRKTGDIPPVFDMMRVLSRQKLSKDWNRDNGRWIPGLFKWLNNRPWVNGNEKKNGTSVCYRTFRGGGQTI